MGTWTCWSWPHCGTGPTHGYALIQALRDRSEGTFDLPEGTVYRC
ncbi:PadR family transcriptional regulator [Micromonospora kangleipakensis]|uniref:PadR family transcriptional regulator n=1 Tax=Micromonospora kangleipakensis TaxID=1077942 RepID=A0A4Q8BGE1_9ACTN|nr:helix-turn-helix transcriptional regulator [Micromonospora kangleipakensis]RZU76373.1 PadR family transcriptional regulator [Micromonospora kangleipakensis]